MTNLVYCPHCGNTLNLSFDLQRKEYESGVCKYCGFDKGFAVSTEYDSWESYRQKQTEYMINNKYDVGLEDQWKANIHVLHIYENPYFDGDAAMKAMKTVRVPSKPAEDPLKAEIKNQLMEKIRNQPHCPTCGSTNVKKLDGIDRTISVALFGLASNKINKSFKCKNCGYTW